MNARSRILYAWGGSCTQPYPDINLFLYDGDALDENGDGSGPLPQNGTIPYLIDDVPYISAVARIMRGPCRDKNESTHGYRPDPASCSAGK